MKCMGRFVQCGIYMIYITYFFWRDRPQWAMAFSFTRFLDHTTHHSWQDSSGRVISQSQRPLPDNYNTHNKHPCPRWDSNPQSQQASGLRLTPQTARPLGPANVQNQVLKKHIIVAQHRTLCFVLRRIQAQISV